MFNLQGCERPLKKNEENLHKMPNMGQKAEIFASENFEKQGNHLKQGTLTALNLDMKMCWLRDQAVLNHKISGHTHF